MRPTSTLTAAMALGAIATVAIAARSTPPKAPPLVLTPGSSELTTTHLKAGSTRFRSMYKPGADSAEREMAIGTAGVSETMHKGKPALLLTTSFVGNGRTFVDTALVMRDGLHPVWEVSRSGQRSTRWEYSGKQVRMTFTQPDSGTRSREHTYDVPVFHFNELDVLVRSLPLREGFEAILPLYSEGSDELEMDSVRVSPRDADGVWSVRFADPAIVSTYGIDGATRRIVRYTVTYRRTGGSGRRVPIE
ncbi:MAG TPA: hypothetical protein VM076_03840 [Gemmatimonadaceae bacterium]|nr:hypothetical protein [Gemmatimonadaceae bacterium]